MKKEVAVSLEGAEELGVDVYPLSMGWVAAIINTMGGEPFVWLS